MIKFSAFYPDVSSAGVIGTSVPATRNAPRGDWSSLTTGTVLSQGDIVTYLGSSFYVNTPHTITVGTTAAPPSNANYTVLASAGVDGQPNYTWFAYADSSDGTVNFTNGVGGTRAYLGISSNHNTSVESSNPTDYTWSKIQGAPAKLLYVTSDRQIITFDGTGALAPATQTTLFTIYPQSLSTGSYTISMTKADGTVINANTYLTAVNGSFAASTNNITWTGSGTQFQMTAANFNTARGTTPGVIITVTHADGVTDTISVVKSADGAAGASGTSGLNTATVYLYQRAASTPTLPSLTTTYTFATAALANINNGWSQTIPAVNGNPLYVTAATASATTATDTIAAGEWAAAVIMAQDGAAGSPGTAGTPGSAGINTATIYLYQRSTTTPSVPSTTATYTFSTSGITGINNGWQTSVPAANGMQLWVTTATALGTGTTDTIATGEWAAPTVMVLDGKLIYLQSDRQLISYDNTGTLSPSTQTTVFTVVPQNLSSGTYTISLTKADGTVINANTYLTAINGSFAASGNNITWTGSGTQFQLTAANFSTARAATNGIIVSITHSDGVSDKLTVLKQQDGATGPGGATGPTGPGGPVIALSADDLSFHFVDGIPIDNTQTITVTATLQNTSESITWSVNPGVTLGLIDGTHRSLTITNFGANQQVVITATGNTSGATDKITLIRDSTPGSDDSLLTDSDFIWGLFGSGTTRPWRAAGGFSRVSIP